MATLVKKHNKYYIHVRLIDGLLKLMTREKRTNILIEKETLLAERLTGDAISSVVMVKAR